MTRTSESGHLVMSPGATGLWRAAVGLTLVLVLLAMLVWWHPSGLYPWLKALHVIAIIAWMAGMLYLPRLFVYHAVAEVGSVQSETFKVMERRLLHAIINPAMVASWVLGLWLAWDGGWYRQGWLIGKVVLVVMLSALHGFLVRWVRDFAADRNRQSQIFFRIINEVPTILMIGIVILVVVKPF
jgi:protoporphyrinogen IX oxidase